MSPNHSAGAPDPDDPARPSRPGAQRRHTPESLVAVAALVFTERGYDGTSMEDLARAAGITKSSIYHHVAGKEELLRLAVGRAVDALYAVLDEPGGREGRAIERLRYIVGRETEVLVAELRYVTLLLRVRGNTDTEKWALDRRREFDETMAGLVAEAVEQGDIRGDIDAKVTTRLLFGMINSITEWLHETPDQRTTLDLPGIVSRIVFDGLATGP